MAGIFGTSTPQKPDFTGLQVNTSTNALPIPLGFGVYKLAPNVIWYGDFRSSDGSAKGSSSSGAGEGDGDGGKGGFFGASKGKTYYAAVELALCEGPIYGIDRVWHEQSLTTLDNLALDLLTGSTPQAPWSYLSTTHADQALGYQGTAIVARSDYDLGPSATIGNLGFETWGILYGSGFNNLDADPGAVVLAFLTDAQFGAGFPYGAIAIETFVGASGDASLQTWCTASGIALSPVLSSQSGAGGILQGWLALCNAEAVWSGDKLKCIPRGDEQILGGVATATSEQRQIPQPIPDEEGAYPTTVTIRVAFSAQYASHTGVVDIGSGATLTLVPDNPLQGQYAHTGGLYTFSALDQARVVAISYVYTTAATYTPNVTPIYDLTEDDFLVASADDDPIKVKRTDPLTAYNTYRLTVLDRDNAYNQVPVETRDQAAIEAQGRLIATSVDAQAICDPLVGSIVAQLMLQRGLNDRAEYSFKLSWEFVLLEAMDVVTIAARNLSKRPVRLKTVKEDADGMFDCTAEDFVAGVGTATLYPVQRVSNTPITRNIPAPPVNVPIIFEPPSDLSAARQIWMAVSGVPVSGQPWGGCFVLMSLDGTSYSQIGQINAPATMGATTAALPVYAGTNPDTTSTLSVDVTMSSGTLTGVADAVAKVDGSLCLVGNELLDFVNATLTGSRRYDLTRLYRRLHGSAAALAPTNSRFAKIDGRIFKYNLPASIEIGTTINLKFRSYNAFGAGVQPLSSCVAYPYQVIGADSAGGEFAAIAAGISMIDEGLMSQLVTDAEDEGRFSDPFVRLLDEGLFST